MRKVERMIPGKPVRTIGELKEAIEQLPDDWLPHVIVHQEPLAAEDIWEYGRSVPPGRPFALLGPLSRRTQANAPIPARGTCAGPALPVDPECRMELVEIAQRDGLIPDAYAKMIRRYHQRLVDEQRRGENRSQGD